MDMNIKLNGSNYVSEKTKRAFEDALQDGHRVKPKTAPSPAPIKANEPSAPSRPQSAQSETQSVQIVDLRPQLEHLERGIDRSYEHQQEILRVHEQYLQGQAEYANVFSQLMEHQRSLLDQEDGTPEHTQALLAVLDHLSKSLSQFHEHQGETLKVHDRFLSHQSEYAQAQVHLLQQQVELAMDDASPSQGVHTSLRDQLDTAIETLPQAEPQVEAPSQPAGRPVELESTSTSHENRAVLPEETESRSSPASDVQATEFRSDGTQGIDPEVLTTSLLECVSESTGYPAEMLELDMDMEADLGIDSIKRVEILGALQDAHPTLPTFEAEDLAELRSLGEIIDYARDRSNGYHDEPTGLTELSESPTVEVKSSGTSPSGDGGALPDAETLKLALLDIVSESTGYPAEMLELDMDMEADLGIDSIKRVEILGALQDAYPDLPQVEAEVLGELRTLGEILRYMDNPPSLLDSEESEEGSKKA
jgi:acyl carrier protein